MNISLLQLNGPTDARKLIVLPDNILQKFVSPIPKEAVYIYNKGQKIELQTQQSFSWFFALWDTSRCPLYLCHTIIAHTSNFEQVLFKGDSV